MSTDFLFSGADPMARDAVLQPNPGAGRVPQPAGASRVAQTAGTVVLVLAIVCSFQGVALAFPDVESGRGAELDLAAEDWAWSQIRIVDTDGEHPNEVSRRAALDLLQQLRAQGLEPDRVVADPDGGVALYMFAERMLGDGSHPRYARIAAMNDGEVVASLADRERDTHEAWDVTASQRSRAIRRIEEFVQR